MLELAGVADKEKCMQCDKRKAVIALLIGSQSVSVRFSLCLTCLTRINRNLSQAICEAISRKDA